MIVTPRQHVVLRTYDGIQLYQFKAEHQTSLRWTRESQETSMCEVVVTSPLLDGQMLEIVPWLHWLDVFDETGQFMYWSGPVQRSVTSRSPMTITASDPSAYFKATRCPMTKRWDPTDPALIAEEFVDAMVAFHGLNVSPIVRVNPQGQRYEFAATKDDAMLVDTFTELSRLGLYWTFVCGVPILGPLSRDPVATLSADDFTGEGPTIVRDGSQSFNDVLVRAANTVSQAKVPMGGLTLQTIVNIDSMFGVSNADKAAREAAVYSASIKDTVTIPDGAQLHPDVPVDVMALIPSARFVLECYGLMVTMELTRMESAGQGSVAVSMVSVDDELPELVELVAKTPTTGAGVR